MKKYVSVICCLVMLLSVMTGCGGSSDNNVRPDDSDSNRPGVNDSVVPNPDNGGANNDVSNNGAGNGTTTSPNANGGLMDDVEQGMDDVGDMARRGADKVDDMMRSAGDKMTGR